MQSISMISPANSTVRNTGMAKKGTEQKVIQERYAKAGLTSAGDPIYKQDWTIAPVMPGRRLYYITSTSYTDETFES